MLPEDLDLLTNYLGGKAQSLIRLRSAGLRVPDFVTIPYSLWQEGSWDPALGWQSLQAMCTQLDLAHDPFTINVLTASLRDQIRRTSIPTEILNLIRGWVNSRKGECFTFIRSSAASEDRADSSSAGQYESLLARTNCSDIGNAVLKVLESYYSPRAAAYRRSINISNAGPKMGIVLQTAILPTAAGIMFGCDPVSGNTDVVVIEACIGLGTAIVSGILTPDRFIIDKRSRKVLHRSLGSKVWQDQVDEAASVHRRRTSSGEKNYFCLQDEQLVELVSQYLRIEQIFGPPQDVEWAFAEDTLWLLQSRPVTAYSAVEELVK